MIVSTSSSFLLSLVVFLRLSSWMPSVEIFHMDASQKHFQAQATKQTAMVKKKNFSSLFIIFRGYLSF